MADWFDRFLLPDLSVQVGGARPPASTVAERRTVPNVVVEEDDGEESGDDDDFPEVDEDEADRDGFLERVDPTVVRRAERHAPVTVLPIPRRIDGNGIALKEHFYVVSRTFNVRAIEYRFVPMNVDPQEDVFEGFVRFLESIYTLIRREFKSDDYVQVTIYSTDLSDSRIGAPLVKVQNATVDPLLTQLENIVQSNQNIALDSGDFTVEVQHVAMPESRGYENKKSPLLNAMSENLEEILKKTRCLMKVDPKTDPFCAAVAMLAGVDHYECKVNNTMIFNFKRRYRFSKKLAKRCLHIFREAGLSTSRGVSLNDFDKLAELPRFKDYVFKIYTSQPRLTCVRTLNPDSDSGPICIYLDNHFHCYVIKSLNALMGKPGALCSDCGKFFETHVKSHVCDNFCCKQCKCKCDSFRIPNASASIKCDACCRYFLSDDCFRKHLQIGASRLYTSSSCVCERVMACLTCGRDLKANFGVRTDKNAYEKTGKNANHVCYKSKCRVCGRMDDMTDHTCFIRPLDPHKPEYQQVQLRKRGEHLYFFDVECADEERECDDGEMRHFFVPNLVVLQREDGREWFWEGEGCMEKFCEFLFLDSERSLAFTPGVKKIFAHNASGFDAILVLKVLLQYLTEDPKILFNQKKIYRLKLGRVEILDSYLWFQCALAKLSKPFNIPCEKGYFPHIFNKIENEDYVGPLPGQDQFGVEFMKEDQYGKFIEWHSEMSQKIENGDLPPWNFREELLKYCRDDVKILRLAWLKFEKSLHEKTGFRPGVDNVSIASFTNLVWRSTIPDLTINVIPKNAYVKNHNQSIDALRWLLWLDNFYFAHELRFANKGSQGEARIWVGSRRMLVDGYHEGTRTVFEFVGCYFHGCPRCTLPDVKCALNNVRNRELDVNLQQRIGQLKEAGYEVEIMRECVWRDWKADPDIARELREIEYLLPHRHSTPIEPRDALYGGRTEAFRLLYEPEEPSKDGEYCESVDVKSLYPYVMKRKSYPVGRPVVIQRPTDFTPGRFFGLVKAKVYPPRNLYIPVLPNRINGKLMFLLCRTCGENLQKETCMHSDDERALYGTWPSPEFYEAVTQGYVIAEIYWVLHYDYSSDTLYRPFVDRFFKMKEEASGYPSWCVTEEDKDKYLKDFEKAEGFCLDPDNIKYDSVLRYIAKLLLNSSWGKWAQNPVRSQSKITHSYSEFLKWVCDDNVVDKQFNFINAESVILSGKDNLQTQFPNQKGSVIHAAFVTCWARLELLKALQLMGTDAFYGDTDSMFYLSRLVRRLLGLEPPMGDNLGDLGSIFDSAETFITEFAAMGPKNYAYKDNSGKVYGKVRGITFNVTSSLKVNLQVMKDVLKESLAIHQRGDPEEMEKRLDPVSGLFDKRIRVERFTMKKGNPCEPYDIAPEIAFRTWRGVMDKRVIDFTSSELLTYPYGF